MGSPAPDVFKLYRKEGTTELRPYIIGEDLTGVSITEGEKPEEGGMIARDKNNHKDLWYVSKSFFDKNYVAV